MEWIFAMGVRIGVIRSSKFGGEYGVIGGEVQDTALI